MIAFRITGIARVRSVISSSKFRSKAYNVVREVTKIAYDETRKRTPEQTGKLRRSIQIRVSGLHGVIWTDLARAIFTEEDTRPHIIRPRRRRVLAFKPRGSDLVVFAHIVHHPGTHGAHMFRLGAEVARRAIPTIARREFGKL